MTGPFPARRSPRSSLTGRSQAVSPSPISRWRRVPGVKGPGARAWLEGQGYGPLPRPNAAMRGTSGVLVAMLGETEALLLRTGDTPPLWSFGSGAALAPGAYPVPRGEGTFWITISGPATPEIFACVCGVDLRPKSFANLQVAQTMVAKASAIIIRDDAVARAGFTSLATCLWVRIWFVSFAVRQSSADRRQARTGRQEEDMACTA